MTTYQTLDPRFVPRVLCASLMVITGCMLGADWMNGRGSFGTISMAIVFSAALIGRILLMQPLRSDVKQPARAAEPREARS